MSPGYRRRSRISSAASHTVVRAAPCGRPRPAARGCRAGVPSTRCAGARHGTRSSGPGRRRAGRARGRDGSARGHRRPCRLARTARWRRRRGRAGARGRWRGVACRGGADLAAVRAADRRDPGIAAQRARSPAGIREAQRVIDGSGRAVGASACIRSWAWVHGAGSASADTMSAAVRASAVPFRAHRSARRMDLVPQPPKTQYAWEGAAHVAFQQFGSGAADARPRARMDVAPGGALGAARAVPVPATLRGVRARADVRQARLRALGSRDAGGAAEPRGVDRRRDRGDERRGGRAGDVDRHRRGRSDDDARRGQPPRSRRCARARQHGRAAAARSRLSPRVPGTGGPDDPGRRAERGRDRRRLLARRRRGAGRSAPGGRRRATGMAGALPAHVGQSRDVGGDRPADRRDGRPRRPCGDQGPDAGAAPPRQRVDARRPRSLPG